MGLARLCRIVMTITMLFAGTGAAFAASIAYTFSGTASGTLNGSPFTGKSLVVTALGDTTTVTTSGSVYCNTPTAVNFSVAGIGSGTVTDSLAVFVNSSGTIGLERPPCNVGSDWLDILFAVPGYQLTTFVGPASGSGAPVGSVNTTAGVLAITSFATGTFQSGPATVLSLSKNFSSSSVVTGQAVTLNFTLTNANAFALTNVAFTDTFPAGLVVYSNPGISNSCGGTPSATPSGGSFSLSGATVSAGMTCNMAVNVIAPLAGAYTNTIPAGAVTSAEGGTNFLPASATLTTTGVQTVVTNTADSGAGSLRDVLSNLDAACQSFTTITFNIPGAGTHVIQPSSPLPAVQCAYVTIDGYSQPGAARNTDTSGGNNAIIKIVLKGSACGAGCDGITIAGQGDGVTGLAIHSFGQAGVRVQFPPSPFTQGTVSGNYIGTDAGGLNALGNGNFGIVASGYGFVQFSDNLISANANGGIQVASGSSILITATGNQIGGKRNGSAGNGNAGPGILFSSIYSTNRINNNFIRFNGGPGIQSSGGTLRIQTNSIYGNAGPGIVSGHKYFPTITAVSYSGGDTIVSGVLNASPPFAGAIIELFHNSSLPTYPEGEKPLGTFNVTLDGAGMATFTQTIAGFAAQHITATAMVDDCGDGCYNSSEFSPAFVAAPASPTITLTPGSLTFAARTISTTSAAQTVTLQNSGPGPLAIASITVSGDFAFTSGCGATLAASATCTIDVTFTPLAAGARSGALTLASNATGSPHTVALAGTGQAAPVGILDASPSPLQFDPQAVGTTSAALLLVLHNSGNATLHRGPESVDGDFRLLAGAEADAATGNQTCGAAIAAGDSCSLALVFTPSALGTRSGAIALPNDGSTPVVTVRLLGTGAAATSLQVLTVTPPLIGFGDQPVGTRSAGREVRLANGSANAAAITELSATTSDFIVSDSCATVPGHGSCSPLVAFRPTALGARNGTLEIRVFGETDPYLVSLNGNGVFNGVPALEVSVTRIGFGNVLLGGSSVQGLRLTNVGLVPVVLGAMNLLDDFAIASACGSTLDVGATCSVQITFFPHILGVHAATLDIFSNAANSPHHVDLSGTGCAIPTATRARVRPVLCGP